MPKFLKNINIQFISLVRKGANNRTVIFKSADGAKDLHEFNIKKTDDAKQMIYGIVYSPDEVDAHGHQASSQEIEAAAHRFMKSLSALNIDKNHTFKHEGAFVAENWIVRNGDPMFPGEKEGAWAVGIKIDDAELYKEARETLPAISMAGTADIITTSDGEGLEKSFFQRLVNFFELNKQEGEMQMDEKKIQELIDTAIKKSADTAPKPMDETAMANVVKAAFGEMIKPVTERLDKIEKTSPGTKQDDTEPSAEEIKKQEEMGVRIAKMTGFTKEGGK
jgi:hypothetical protein